MLIKKDPAIITSYLEDASGMTDGQAEKLVIPETENEVAEYLKSAAKQSEPITVIGGRTGTAGGCIAHGGTLLSLERLNSIGSIIQTGEHTSLKLGAGVYLSTIKHEASKNGLLYGPDPTERTATIGGNLATNASGGQGYKYGTTRDHILGLTAICSSGESIRVERGQCPTERDRLTFPLVSGKSFGLSRPVLPQLNLNKNAAGYYSKPYMDPIDLLIGMDGTLAVITSVTVKLLPKPPGIFSLVSFFSELQKAIDCAAAIRKLKISPPIKPGIAPSAVEFMDERALQLIRPSFTNIPYSAKAALMLDQEFTDETEEKLLLHWENFLKTFGVSENNIWFAEHATDREHFREFRHALPEAVNNIIRRRKLPKVSTDIAVPEEAFPEMIKLYYNTLNHSKLNYLIFGHIGECHLHVNVLPRNQAEFAAAKKLYLDFSRQAVELGGTISAEHGIGKIKHDFLKLMVGEAGFREMARVKRIFDPACILNRGNIFPEEYL